MKNPLVDMLVQNESNPYSNSLAVVEVAQEQILQKVAWRAWENELLSKYKNKYVKQEAL